MSSLQQLNTSLYDQDLNYKPLHREQETIEQLRSDVVLSPYLSNMDDNFADISFSDLNIFTGLNSPDVSLTGLHSPSITELFSSSSGNHSQSVVISPIKGEPINRDSAPIAGKAIHYIDLSSELVANNVNLSSPQGQGATTTKPTVQQEALLSFANVPFQQNIDSSLQFRQNKSAQQQSSNNDFHNVQLLCPSSVSASPVSSPLQPWTISSPNNSSPQNINCNSASQSKPITLQTGTYSSPSTDSLLSQQNIDYSSVYENINQPGILSTPNDDSLHNLHQLPRLDILLKDDDDSQMGNAEADSSSDLQPVPFSSYTPATVKVQTISPVPVSCSTPNPEETGKFVEQSQEFSTIQYDNISSAMEGAEIDDTEETDAKGPGGKGRRRNKFSAEEKKERRKKQNREAAERARQKRKDTQFKTLREIEDLQEKTNSLQEQLKVTEEKNERLEQLIQHHMRHCDVLREQYHKYNHEICPNMDALASEQ